MESQSQQVLCIPKSELQNKKDEKRKRILIKKGKVEKEKVEREVGGEREKKRASRKVKKNNKKKRKNICTPASNLQTSFK
jgi:hypothetical protein